MFETRFGSFSKSPSVEAAKFIEAVERLFKIIFQVFVIPVWIDKFYRLKSIQEFYDCMDVMYNFGDTCIEKKMEEIRDKLENRDIQDEDAAEFLTFLISRDDINSKEISANLVEILMAAVETVCYDKLKLLKQFALAISNAKGSKKLVGEIKSLYCVQSEPKHISCDQLYQLCCLNKKDTYTTRAYSKG